MESLLALPMSDRRCRGVDVLEEIWVSGERGQMMMAPARNIEGVLRSAAWVGQMPWIYWLNDYLAPVIGDRPGIAARHGSTRKFAA